MKNSFIIYCSILIELILVNNLNALYCSIGTSSQFSQTSSCQSHCAIIEKIGCLVTTTTYDCDLSGITTTNGIINRCTNNCCDKITVCSSDFCNFPTIYNKLVPIYCFDGSDPIYTTPKCNAYCVKKETYNCLFSSSNSVSYSCDTPISLSKCGFFSLCCNSYTVCDTDFCNSLPYPALYCYYGTPSTYSIKKCNSFCTISINMYDTSSVTYDCDNYQGVTNFDSTNVYCTGNTCTQVTICSSTYCNLLKQTTAIKTIAPVQSSKFTTFGVTTQALNNQSFTTQNVPINPIRAKSCASTKFCAVFKLIFILIQILMINILNM